MSMKLVSFTNRDHSRVARFWAMEGQSGKNSTKPMVEAVDKVISAVEPSIFSSISFPLAFILIYIYLYNLTLLFVVDLR